MWNILLNYLCNEKIFRNLFWGSIVYIILYESNYMNVQSFLNLFNSKIIIKTPVILFFIGQIVIKVAYSILTGVIFYFFIEYYPKYNKENKLLDQEYIKFEKIHLMIKLLITTISTELVYYESNKKKNKKELFKEIYNYLSNIEISEVNNIEEFAKKIFLKFEIPAEKLKKGFSYNNEININFSNEVFIRIAQNNTKRINCIDDSKYNNFYHNHLEYLNELNKSINSYSKYLLGIFDEPFITTKLSKFEYYYSENKILNILRNKKNITYMEFYYLIDVKSILNLWHEYYNSLELLESIKKNYSVENIENDIYKIFNSWENK